MKTPTLPKLDDLPVAPPKPEDFTSRLRSPAVAARVGLWLGISFGVCFVTGLLSHYAQNASHPIPYPTSPAWGYRVTQGLHVVSGTAAIPLLLVKLWAVYPKLFDGLPPISRKISDLRQLTVVGLERVSIAVLVSSAIFQLLTGLQNTAQWYPWAFDFRKAHYALGWICIGALLVHIAVKLPIIRDALTGDVDETTHDRPSAVKEGVLSRRGLLRTTWVAAGVAVVATAGGTVPVLRKVSIFSVRSGDDGHGGPPINKAAAEAGTADYDLADYSFTLSYAGVEKTMTYEALAAMPQTTESLPISCVEGWSAGATWTGVRVRDLLDLVGAPRGRDVTVRSFASGAYATMHMQSNFADDSRTLLALKLNGETLSEDHGFPARIMAPDRPGVLQTKWVNRIEVSA